MPASQYTRTLAKYIAHLKYSDLPNNVVAVSKRRILDTVGVALRGSDTLAGRTVGTYVRSLKGKREATLIGYGTRVSCQNATWANTVMARSVELDDIHWHSHPGAATIPAAIAVCETIGASGKDLITAIVAGYEGMSRIAETFIFQAFEKGIDFHLGSAAFGSALATTKALNFEERETASTIGMGLLPLFPWRATQKYITSAQIAFGWSSMAGVVSAFLVREGIPGVETIFDGAAGYDRALADKYDPEMLIEGLGKKYNILETYMKRHPSCSLTHGMIDAVLDILSEHRLTPKDIERVDVRTAPIVYDTCNRPVFEDVFSTYFSLQFLAALTIVEKRVLDMEDFTQEKIADPEIANLAKKVHASVSPELTAAYNQGISTAPTDVEIRTANGKVYTRRRLAPKGWPPEGATDEDVNTKFERMASKCVSKANMKKISETVKKLERLDNVSDLVKLLVAPN